VVERKEEFWEKLFDSPEMWDAPLTDKGKEQCAGLAQQIDQEGADVDLIVVSPLTRTLQVRILMPGGWRHCSGCGYEKGGRKRYIVICAQRFDSLCSLTTPLVISCRRPS